MQDTSLRASLQTLNRSIVSCEKCPRLRKHCQQISQIKRKAYLNETYWGKPIHGFGDPNAQIMIVGLAPAAHGANRTGRIFTGDRSGEWLYRALFKASYANQPESQNINDGLVLKNTYISCTVKCAPPDNKPTPTEIKKCSPYLKEELQYLKNVQIFIALGRLAFDALWPMVGSAENKKPTFEHGKIIHLPTASQNRWMILSYHPSQQNTFTKKLTEPMFDSVFSSAKDILTGLPAI